jgi:hypothetical protein
MSTTPQQNKREEVPAALSLLGRIAAQQAELAASGKQSARTLTASEELRTQICTNQFCQCTRREKTLESIPDLIRARLLRHLQQEAQRSRQDENLQREARNLLAALGSVSDYSKAQPRVQIFHTPVILSITRMPDGTAGTRYSTLPTITATTKTGLDNTVRKKYADFAKRARRVETNWQYPGSESAKKKARLSTNVSKAPPKKRPFVTWATRTPHTTAAATSTTPMMVVEQQPPRRVSETSELSLRSVLGSSSPTQTTDETKETVYARPVAVP